MRVDIAKMLFPDTPLWVRRQKIHRFWAALIGAVVLVTAVAFLLVQLSGSGFSTHVRHPASLDDLLNR